MWMNPDWFTGTHDITFFVQCHTHTSDFVTESEREAEREKNILMWNPFIHKNWRKKRFSYMTVETYGGKCWIIVAERVKKILMLLLVKAEIFLTILTLMFSLIYNRAFYFIRSIFYSKT